MSAKPTIIAAASTNGWTANPHYAGQSASF